MPDLTKAGPLEGHEPALLAGDAVLAPLPERALQLREVRAKAFPSWYCRLGSSQGDVWIPKEKGLGQRKTGDLGVLSKQIHSLPISKRKCENKISKIHYSKKKDGT